MNVQKLLICAVFASYIASILKVRIIFFTSDRHSHSVGTRNKTLILDDLLRSLIRRQLIRGFDKQNAPDNALDIFIDHLPGR